MKFEKCQIVFICSINLSNTDFEIYKESIKENKIKERSKFH